MRDKGQNSEPEGSLQELLVQDSSNSVVDSPDFGQDKGRLRLAGSLDWIEGNMDWPGVDTELDGLQIVGDTELDGLPIVGDTELDGQPRRELTGRRIVGGGHVEVHLVGIPIQMADTRHCSDSVPSPAIQQPHTRVMQTAGGIVS